MSAPPPPTYTYPAWPPPQPQPPLPSEETVRYIYETKTFASAYYTTVHHTAIADTSSSAPYADPGLHYDYGTYHPYSGSESSLAHALRPVSSSETSGAYHQPRSFSTYTHPVPGYDHVLHEQQGVVSTGPRYEHAPAAPTQPYSINYDHGAAQPSQKQYYAASPQVKTEDDWPTLYGEDGSYDYTLTPAPPSWSHHVPTRPATPQAAHSEYSLSGSSFASSLSAASWRPSTESSLSMALGHPTSVSAPPLPRFKTEELDNRPFLPQPEPSASPSPDPSTPVASGSASRGRRSKIPPKHVHRPLACHACRTRKIACLAPSGTASGATPGVCGPCARRGRECVFPAENGRGKHKVAQKQARLAREAEQRAMCKREWA